MIKISIVIATTLFATVAFAQTSEEDQLRFGFKAGANISNVYDTEGDEFDANAKLGIAAGAFLSIPIGAYIGIQPEMMFSQKGYQTSGSMLGIDYKYRHTSNFIDVPIMFALRPAPFITLLAGPQYSYLLSERTEFTNTFFSDDKLVESSDFDNQDVRKNILGAVIGVDANITDMVISARAGMDITHNNGNGSQTEPRYKNVYYQATIGYRF